MAEKSKLIALSKGCTAWLSVAPYLDKPPLYSEAISRDSSMKLTVQSWMGAMMGGDLTVVSIKLSLNPRLQVLFDFLQF